MVDALYSATYVEDYLDCVENLPDDLQRYLTRMRELDVVYQDVLRDVEQLSSFDASQKDSRRRNILRVQTALIQAQELGDQKLQLVQQLQDLIENKSRQLEIDYHNLGSDFGKEQETTDNHVKEKESSQQTPVVQPVQQIDKSGERQSKRPRRLRTEVDTSYPIEPISEQTTPLPRATATATKKNQATGKKKKRKSRQQREETPPREDEIPIDPDEPTYCLCDQISYGEMILCDNDLCPIEWFHFSCVALATKPKGKWFCPKCRGDRPNVMKPKAQFLKELERYNKEKEEKA